MFGFAAGCVLADWGAEVLKIEPVAIGDPSRLFSRMLGADLPFNPPFEMDNRGKRSIAIDLGHPEGLAIALELIDAADVNEWLYLYRPNACRLTVIAGKTCWQSPEGLT